MIDPTKSWQRNIRIEPELWAYVRELAPKGHTRNGDCSSVIRSMIIKHKQYHGPARQLVCSTTCANRKS